jgi:hypothetical protein
MKWNYRICARDSIPGYGLNIHEVYYDENEEIEFYTENPVGPHGDIADEMYLDMIKMMDALDKDIIDLDKVDKMFREKAKGNNA